jgi:hypothetical protein
MDFIRIFFLTILLTIAKHTVLYCSGPLLSPPLLFTCFSVLGLGRSIEPWFVDPVVLEPDAEIAFEHGLDSDHATEMGSDPDPT